MNFVGTYLVPECSCQFANLSCSTAGRRWLVKDKKVIALMTLATIKNRNFCQVGKTSKLIGHLRVITVTITVLFKKILRQCEKLLNARVGSGVGGI